MQINKGSVDMELCFIILLWVLWPTITYHLAKNKGYDTGAAILWGVVFGLFAVIVYAVLGVKNTGVE